MTNTLLERHVCAGAPFDADGMVRDTINDCPFAPTSVCVGLHEAGDGSWVTLLLLTCELHLAPVMDVVAMHDPDSAMRAEIAALPSILLELGDDVWTLDRQAA